MTENSTNANRCEEHLDQVFGALSDPSRRKMIALLREAGELKVGDLAEVFSMSFNGVSKHLKVLERAGLVSRRVEGREHWLHVNWEGLRPAYNWLHYYRHFWGARLDALTGYLQQEGEEK